MLVIHGGAWANAYVHHVRNPERTACKFMIASQMPAPVHPLNMDKKFGTVGAVALDMLGNLAPVNSTDCNSSNQNCTV